LPQLVFLGQLSGGFGSKIVNACERDHTGCREIGINADVLFTQRASAENRHFYFARFHRLRRYSGIERKLVTSCQSSVIGEARAEAGKSVVFSFQWKLNTLNRPFDPEN
jgi:hypothetical protein